MGKLTKILPSQDVLHTLFNYEPHTGILTWRARTDIKSVKAGFNRRFAGQPVGAIKSNGYRATQMYGGFAAVHRVIWKWMTGNDPVALIDHKNGLRDDNRWVNLREATYKENSANIIKRKRK